MKKIFRNSRLIAVAFLTIFSATSSNAMDSIRVKEAVPAELKFAGMLKNNPLFQLNITGNQDQDDFTILIGDSQGNILYRENIKAETFSKKFLLNTEELGDETLYFTITSRKTRKELVYEISSANRYVSEVIINQVK